MDHSNMKLNFSLCMVNLSFWGSDKRTLAWRNWYIYEKWWWWLFRGQRRGNIGW